MAVFKSTEMSSNSGPISVKPSQPASTPTGSEFSQEQWLDLLRVLSPSSRTNLHLALKQFLDENREAEDEADAVASIAILTNDQANAHLIQPPRTILPAASTLVPSTNNASIPCDEMPQNTYGTDRYMGLLRQSLKLSPLLKSAATAASTSSPVSSIDPPNGLDTLAAAALASTNSETNMTPSTAVTVLQGKPVPGTGILAIPISAQLSPTMIGGFKQDPTNQRQSPTIRETPKRLAATRAEAEQLAAILALSPTVGGVRYSGGQPAHKRIRMPETDLMNVSQPNVLLSNGSLKLGVADQTAVVKRDPESYQFHQDGANDGTPPIWPMASSSSLTGDTNRRRSGREETVNDDEVARREKRRERNRVAAAKCRQNRQNQIEELKARRNVLEAERNQTRQLLQNAQHEKLQLEELLKKHVHSGCPTGGQYFRNGTLILRLPAGNTSSTASTSIRIIQPTPTAASTGPLPSPTAILPIISTPIKQEEPSTITYTPSPTVVVPAAQRPNILPLTNPAGALDSLSAAAQLWSPSIATRIKTPGGESWVNSQIGPPPSTGIKIEKDLSAFSSSTPTVLSTPDLLHRLGISLGSSTTPIQITVAGGNGNGEVVDKDAKVTTAS